VVVEVTGNEIQREASVPRKATGGSHPIEKMLH
jgi:hypothetical protein